MTIGQVCFSHEYCTDCPARAECTVRPTFYDNSQYLAWRNETVETTKVLARSLYHMPEQLIDKGIESGIKMMDKRRDMELRIHPTFSKN